MTAEDIGQSGCNGAEDAVQELCGGQTRPEDEIDGAEDGRIANWPEGSGRAPGHPIAVARRDRASEMVVVTSIVEEAGLRLYRESPGASRREGD